MSLYLGYGYSVNLTQEEKNEIDERVSYSRERFYAGFNVGLKYSLIGYSIYSLATRPALASDTPPTSDSCPASTPKVDPAPVDAKPVPDRQLIKPKPGFKPLTSRDKGLLVGGATGVCTSALQSGDFISGLLCAILLIGLGLINNRRN